MHLSKKPSLSTKIFSLLKLLILSLNNDNISLVNGSGAETWDYPNIFQKNVIAGSKAQIDRYPYHATVNIRPSKSKDKDKDKDSKNDDDYEYYYGYDDNDDDDDENDLYNICGGTLIHRNWIVTAAHCTEAKGVDMIVEIGRDSYRKSVDSVYEIRDIEFKCAHPFFNPSNFQYDIALLYFEDGIDNIDPVTIDIDNVDLEPYLKKFDDDDDDSNKDEEDEDEDNNDIDFRFFNNTTTATTISPKAKIEPSPLRVIGYGSTSIFGDGPYPNRLQEADVYYINDKQCENVVRNTGADMFTDWTMCASGFGIQDTCIGDSGGPLLIPSRKGDTLVGVVSIGPVPCMEADTPVLYTRISKAYDWIMNVIDGDTDLCK